MTLTDEKETTLYEIRAGVYDCATVGSFKLLKDIEVINLADIDHIVRSPAMYEQNLFVHDTPVCKGKSPSGGVLHRLTGVSPQLSF